jgi:GLPGLI family protein
MYLFKNKIILALAIILLGPYCLAQDFQGKAYYKTSRNVSISMDSTSVSPERQAAMNEMIRKQFSKEYTLVFDQQESLYKEQAKLDGPSQGGGMVIVSMSDASSNLYKNTKEQRFTGVRDLFGKAFIVKDELEEIEWKLESETKQIGQYTCHKATSTRTVERVVIGGTDDEQQTESSEIIITAWYTPEIAVSTGPDRFWGLPGLIMEINEGKSKIICSKIVLNPDEVTEIKEPLKGKVVTQEEFDEMMAAKMKEMEQMNRGGKKQEGAHQMKITIDG